MKVLFYGNKCQFSKQVIEKLKELEIIDQFKLVCMDNNKNNFERITEVPSLVDSNLREVLVGKKILEYITNNKFFNFPTNNVLLWKDRDIPKPEIIDDKLANDNQNLVSNKDFNDKDKLKNDNDESIIKSDCNELVEKEKNNVNDIYKKGKLNKSNSLLLRRR